MSLFAKDTKNKVIGSQEELTIIMRSLGFSPTIEEIEKYYKTFEKGESTSASNTSLMVSSSFHYWVR